MGIIHNNINHHSQITYNKGRYTKSKSPFIIPFPTINMKSDFQLKLQVAFS